MCRVSQVYIYDSPGQWGNIPILFFRGLTLIKQDHQANKVSSWSWSYGSCKQCLSPLMLWVRISIRAMCTTLCDQVCQWLATGRWLSPGTPSASSNKTDILLKVALKHHQTNKQTKNQTNNYVLVTACTIGSRNFVAQ